MIRLRRASAVTALSLLAGPRRQRRVRVGVLAGSGRCTNSRKFVTTSLGMGNEGSLRAGTDPKAGIGFGEGH
jgi:hypothetical protein